MGNILIDDNNILSIVDYSKIINTSTEIVKKMNVRVKDGRLVLNDLNKIIIEELNKNNIKNILEINPNKKPKKFSVNIKDKERFSKEIAKLEKELRTVMIKHCSNLRLTSLSEVYGDRVNIQANYGLEYQFTPKSFQKEMVSFKEPKMRKDAMARVDEVTITVETSMIQKYLKENLIKILNNEIDDEEDLEDRIEEVCNKKQDIRIMEKLLNDKILARINRTVAYLYLSILMQDSNEKDEAFIFLKDYIRRFYLLDKYLIELSNRASSESKLILDKEIDIANNLSNGDAFDTLPVIGIVEMGIFEGTADNSKIFKAAVKIKANGNVNQEGVNSCSSYKYRLTEMSNMINNSESQTKFRNVNALFLYNFMLRDLGNLDFNPIEYWEKIRDAINNCNGDREKIKKLIKHSINYLNTEQCEVKINKIIRLLDNTLKHTKSRDKTYNYNRKLVLSRQVLDDNLEEGNFFKKQDYNIKNMKYVSIVEEVTDLNNIFMSSNIKIDFKSKIFYSTSAKDSTKLKYEIENYKIMPIIFYPDLSDEKNKNVRADIKKMFESINKYSIIAIPYQNEENIRNYSDRLVYNITYNLITFTAIQVILDILCPEEKKQLFIPIVRAHSASNDGGIIRGYSKALEHILSQDYLASSQGFDIKGVRYKYMNAITSLYSKIPKKFIEENYKFKMNKVAIMTVTSIVADSAYDDNSRSINTILGEVILYDADEDGKVSYKIYSTFSDNVSKDELFTCPRVINDTITTIYNLGYKEILYIARAPYTSNLNITNEKENLYFMNEDALEKMMNDRSGLMIYPMYFSKYSAFSLKPSENALYISSNEEIDNMLQNQNSSIAGVLNLYSGKVVGNDKLYRKVIIYSTLCEKYINKQFNAKIYSRLIEDGKYKEDITRFLIMHHYARYEKADNNVTIKVDPYDKIIGDDSVGKLSMLKNDEKGNKEFNNLAFLTEIHKVIKREKNNGFVKR